MQKRIPLMLLTTLLAGCGRVADEPQGGAEVAPTTPEVAQAPAGNEAAQPLAHEARRKPLKPSGYRSLSIKLAGVPVLDRGVVELMIDTTHEPVVGSLIISARGESASLEAQLKLDMTPVLHDERNDPTPFAGGSSFTLQTAEGPREIGIERFEIQRVQAAGRRATLKVRGFGTDGTEVMAMQTEFNINCLVTPEQLGQTPLGNAEARLLSTDEALESSACAKFAALL